LIGWSGNTYLQHWKGLGLVTYFLHGFLCSSRPHKHVFKLINLIPNFSPCHVGLVKEILYPRSCLQWQLSLFRWNLGHRCCFRVWVVGVRNIASLCMKTWSMIYVSNPGPSAPVIVPQLNNFRSFSGYKLNYQKSECFPINDLAMQIKQDSFPFYFTHSGYKYLGINITRSFTSFLGANFTPLNNQMKAYFQSWSSLPLTIAGRVQLVKMNVLPKYLYLFQCLPLFLTK
jgi:hypothetical protein